MQRRYSRVAVFLKVREFRLLVESRSFHSGSGGECCCQRTVGDVIPSLWLKVSLHGRLPLLLLIPSISVIVSYHAYPVDDCSIRYQKSTPTFVVVRAGFLRVSFVSLRRKVNSTLVPSTPLLLIVLACIIRSSLIASYCQRLGILANGQSEVYIAARLIIVS
jgi:hypothetical protein